jgi:hypothetical protein
MAAGFGFVMNTIEKQASENSRIILRSLKEAVANALEKTQTRSIRGGMGRQ